MKKYILSILLGLLILPGLAQTAEWDSSFTEKSEIETELEIYPNPCKNNKITVDFNSNEISEIRLTNITGKQVLLRNFKTPTYKTQILLNEIPNGIYIIQVISSDKLKVVKKLIISRN
uniref:T9SS type A sorting domain-containing protein n=1 Tax=uncultured Draconibacterium sp. TaxID=1573823 RepID=UPI003217D910